MAMDAASNAKEAKDTKDTKDAKDVKESKEPKEKPSGPVQTLEEIRDCCRLIERSVLSKEPRFLVRALRGLQPLRPKLKHGIVARVLNGFYTHSDQAKEELLDMMPKEKDVVAMEVDGKQDAKDAKEGGLGTGRLRGAKSAMTPLLPEVDAYLHLLLLLFLLDVDQKGDNKAASKSLECAEALMLKLVTANRRSMDHMAARCYYYYTRAYETSGRVAEINGVLHARLRTATLRNDFEGQAVLINCILRSYISQNLYDQADKLVNKTNFPESASNNEWARYLYYLGRIKAIQLEYSEAHKHLVQSLRKAPQQSAVGFRHTVLKLSIIVELLLGEIPDRQTFLQKANKRALAPYLQVTQAVRSGDVSNFQKALDTHGKLFREDKTYTLILRLHQNVIKTAIRTISVAYSRISLMDVATKLKLESSEEAEYIIAKAIRDGVIEATLDHENGWMQSKENSDIYCTREPQLAFHERISFCLDLHNSSVKAMRFPPKSYNQDLESAEDRREREAQDLELAKEMAEEDEDMI